MTREQLIEAICDNKDKWSCLSIIYPYCPKIIASKADCRKCAEKLLDDYEDKIREDCKKEQKNE